MSKESRTPEINHHTQAFYLAFYRCPEDPKETIATIAFPLDDINQVINLPLSVPNEIFRAYEWRSQAVTHQDINSQKSQHFAILFPSDNKISKDQQKQGKVLTDLALQPQNCFDWVGQIILGYDQNQGFIVTNIEEYPTDHDLDAIISLWQKKSPHLNQSNNFQRLLSNK
jgi:hypothetical protein